MEPVINEGEQVFITKTYYRLNKIKRNDIIGLYNNQKIEIKRIIGMPDDRLLLNQYSLSVNGTEIINTNKMQYEIQNKEIILRNGEFFVVGENYTKSVDSRIYGPITKNQIIGKVL
jgi:signal peptidase I